LAILAGKSLVQNGSLVTYCNQTQIPQIIQYLQNMGLTYWHTIAVILENTFARNFPRRIVYKYKPLLWFVKGKRTKDSDFLSDVIYSKKPLKDNHPWQQSTVEAEHVISRLTTEGQTVLDPMMGSGTTGIASLKLSRKFIGIEIDAQKFEATKANLAS
jgi:DNA modification methylase